MLMTIHATGTTLLEFFSSPYTLQEDLNIDGRVISSGSMVCEGTFLPPPL